jgi:hypothetical protein
VEDLPRRRFARWLIVALAVGGLVLTWLYFIRADSSTNDRSLDARLYRWSWRKRRGIFGGIHIHGTRCV